MSPVTVWVDGLLSDSAEATISALDHGITVGDGVFETCKVTHGVPFALTRHLCRLERSAAGMGLPGPEEAIVRQAVTEVLGASDLALGRLRITWTGGVGPLSSERAAGSGTLVVAAAPAPPWPTEVAAVTVPWTRNENSATAGLKTTSYAENVVALQEAHARGGSEALMANSRGELCEGTGSNVFVVIDDQVRTPPLSSGCLAGITRELLLDWAADDGLDVIEETLPFDVLDDADEVVLTSSTRDVQPLTWLDGRRLDVGPMSRRLVGLFAHRSAADPDPVSSAAQPNRVSSSASTST
jgi:branched-chain amino acid aminotransferase